MGLGYRIWPRSESREELSHSARLIFPLWSPWRGAVGAAVQGVGGDDAARETEQG
jgi:hypothetical protein